MERTLDPEKLTAEQNQSNGEKVHSHWKPSQGNFFDEIGTEDRSVTESNKLNCIVKYVSSDAYDNISDCKTYNEAIKRLNNL